MVEDGQSLTIEHLKKAKELLLSQTERLTFVIPAHMLDDLVSSRVLTQVEKDDLLQGKSVKEGWVCSFPIKKKEFNELLEVTS